MGPPTAAATAAYETSSAATITASATFSALYPFSVTKLVNR